jgi:hypothetical protein
MATNANIKAMPSFVSLFIVILSVDSFIIDIVTNSSTHK